MSIIRRGDCAAGCFAAIASSVPCLAWVAHAGAPVPRVLGVKPASRAARS